MVFNIAEFKSVVEARGFQKSNKFRVRFSLPARIPITLEASRAQATRQMEFWCDSAVLPGVQQSLRQVLRYGYGPIEKKPFAPMFNDVTFTIMADQKNINWSYFHAWISTVLNFDARNGIRGKPEQKISPFEVFYKVDYMVDLDVTIFDDKGDPSNRIVFREAFPHTAQDLPLNWADNNNIMRMPITFSFHDWFWAPVPESEMLNQPTVVPNDPSNPSIPDRSDAP